MSHLPFLARLLRLHGRASLCALLVTSAASAQFTEGWSILQTWTGTQSGEQFGWASEKLGDLDGDGACDLAISGIGFGAGRGRASIYSSGSGALLFQHTGSAGASLGFDVGPAGDFNQDGTEDYLASAISHGGAGAVFIYSGANGTLLQTFVGESAGDTFGYEAACMGDLDHDLVPDYIVGAINHSSVFATAGRGYLISGATGLPLQTFDGGQAGANLGSAVGNVGDIDHDSVADLVIGAMNDGPGVLRRGRAYVYSGASGQLIWTLKPQVKGRGFGQFFTSAAGDVDADGTPDIFVGDFLDIENGSSSGKAYVFSGATGLVLHCWTGPVANAGMGPGRGAGDWDEDGHDDIFVAEWSRTGAVSGGGICHLYSGRDGSELRRFTGSVVGANFGFDLNPMGDVTGNGSIDFLITGASQGGNTGVAHLLTGDPELAALTPGQAGVNNTLSLIGAVPNTVLLQIVGSQAGSTPVGGGVHLDIAVPFFVVPIAADASGSVTAQGPIPASLSGSTWLLQTFDFQRKVVSNLVQQTFP